MSSVADIKAAIQGLPPSEQVEIIRFAISLGRKRSLIPDELNRLTQRLVDSDDPSEIEKLKSALLGGFYGDAR
jgi:hypothetical protein